MLCARASRRPRASPANLLGVTDPLIELRMRLDEAAARLRSGELEPDEALALVEECARLASEASTRVEARARGARAAARPAGPAAAPRRIVHPAAVAPAYPDHLRVEVERYLESLRFGAQPASE